MLVVHHLNDSRSQRILWLLEELGLHYELETYERDPVTRFAPPALKAVHPLGKSPYHRASEGRWEGFVGPWEVTASDNRPL